MYESKNFEDVQVGNFVVFAGRTGELCVKVPILGGFNVFNIKRENGQLLITGKVAETDVVIYPDSTPPENGKGVRISRS